VLIEGIPCGTGAGYSKKESDQSAAKQALKRIKSDKNLLKGIKNANAGKSNNPSGE
jgi:ribonuclease-3